MSGSVVLNHMNLRGRYPVNAVGYHCSIRIDFVDFSSRSMYYLYSYSPHIDMRVYMLRMISARNFLMVSKLKWVGF